MYNQIPSNKLRRSIARDVLKGGVKNQSRCLYLLSEILAPPVFTTKELNFVETKAKDNYLIHLN